VASTQAPETQFRLVQSVAARQSNPPPHGAQTGPPQSMSDSSPLVTASVHVGDAQIRFTHDPL
jgi:hypothetical protein